MSRRRVLCGIALVLAVGLLVGPGRTADEDFVKVFNGKDLTGLKIVPESAKETFNAEDGVLKVSGKPNAYFCTEKSYKNFVLRFEWRYPKNAGNSGLLVYIQTPHKVWPKCVEVQGQYAGHGTIFAISGAKGEYTNDAAARKKALKPHMEWNTTEVISMNGHLEAKVNGVTVGKGQTKDLTEGPLGWQSEGAPIEFRNIVIKEMK